LQVLADPGYWFLDTGCFWISPLMQSLISSIWYQASSICPENAIISSIPSKLVEKILCNVGVY
jgi:hypothetical protein